MKIKRMQVTGGFLNEFDLEFSDGLNVIVGPRGSGKSSVIELIRFAFGLADDPNSKTIADARNHALSVLGEDGVVTLTLEDGGDQYEISRSPSDDLPDAPSFYPIIYSQKELEEISVSPSQRLALIDAFISKSKRLFDQEQGLAASVRSTQEQIERFRRDCENLQDQIAGLASVPEQIVQASEEQTKLLAGSQKAQTTQAELDALSREFAKLGAQQNATFRAHEAITPFQQAIDAASRSIPQLEKWQEIAGAIDLLAEARKRISAASAALATAASAASGAAQDLLNKNRQVALERQKVEERGKGLRQVIEAFKSGAGEVAKRISELEEKRGKLEGLKGSLLQTKERIEELKKKRGDLLDELEALRFTRFSERKEVADKLVATLGSTISIVVVRAGNLRQYAEVIANSLRGSKIQYTSLAPAMAKKISPRELVELIEEGETGRLADIIGIPKERADRVASQLLEVGCAPLLVCDTDDQIEFKLLDGMEWKSIDRLSVGQKCTVVLPIALSHKEKILVIDQPEDHLDNAFIVSTVVEALLERGGQSQTIVSTHNANIPVLGEAKKLVVLTSDGDHGHVQHDGDLDEEASVEAILQIMEGGREAFARRGAFYQQRAG